MPTTRNPGRAARLARRVEAASQRGLHRRLAGWVRQRKGTPGYWRTRHRRRRARKGT